MEVFQLSEEAYILAIEACCTPVTTQDLPTAPQSRGPFSTAPPSASRPMSEAPPASARMTDGVLEEKMSGSGRPSLAEEERDCDRPVVAAGVSEKGLPAAAAQGGDDAGRGSAERVAEAVEGSHAVGVDFTDGDAVVGEVAGGAELGGVPAATEGVAQQPPTTRKKGSKKGQEQDFEWFVIPGGRAEPPELDEDGNEKGLPSFAAGGARSMNDAMGGAGAGAANCGGGASEAGAAAAATAAPGWSGRREEGVSTSETASLRGTSGGPPSSQISSSTASRVDTVTVLSPAAAGGSYAGQESRREILPAAGNHVEGGSSIGSRSNRSSAALTNEVEDKGIEWERARAILDDMLSADHLPTPPAEVFQAVLSACDAAGRVGEARDVAQAMVVAGHVPSARLVARLMASHSDELERERREVEEAAAAPAGD